MHRRTKSNDNSKIQVPSDIDILLDGYLDNEKKLQTLENTNRENEKINLRRKIKEDYIRDIIKIIYSTGNTDALENPQQYYFKQENLFKQNSRCINNTTLQSKMVKQTQNRFLRDNDRSENFDGHQVLGINNNLAFHEIKYLGDLKNTVNERFSQMHYKMLIATKDEMQRLINKLEGELNHEIPDDKKDELLSGKMKPTLKVRNIAMAKEYGTEEKVSETFMQINAISREINALTQVDNKKSLMSQKIGQIKDAFTSLRTSREDSKHTDFSIIKKDSHPVTRFFEKVHRTVCAKLNIDTDSISNFFKPSWHYITKSVENELGVTKKYKK